MQADMRHFKELTMNSVLIMGRKTLDSIGASLPGRRTIVLTRGEESQIPGVKTVHSLEEAYEVAGDNSEIFIAGGSEIYKQAIPGIKRIYATEVDAIISGADTYFLPLDVSWHKIDEKQYLANKDNKYPYNFVTYERQG